MRVLLENRKTKSGTKYFLRVMYRDENNKKIKKTLEKSSYNSQELENYKYRLNNKIESNRITSFEELKSIAEEMFKENGFIVNSKIHSSVTFKEYAKEVIDYKFAIKNIKEKTYKSYLGALEHLNSIFGNIKVESMKTRMVNEYISIKSSEISSSTLDLHLTVLNLVVKSALRDDILNKDIMAGIEKPKKSKKETYIYTEEEVGTLVRTLRENASIELNLRVQLILKLGLRNSEVLGLCWDAIDFSNQLIHIKRITTSDLNGKTILDDRTKTNTSNRVLRLSNQLTEELKEYKRYQLANNLMCDSQLLFHRKGKPIINNSFTKEFQRFLKKYDLPETTVHGLRHFYGSLLIKNGRPITEVSRNMGHANPTITTSIYAHELDDVTKKSTDLMDDLYANIF